MWPFKSKPVTPKPAEAPKTSWKLIIRARSINNPNVVYRHESYEQLRTVFDNLNASIARGDKIFALADDGKPEELWAVHLDDVNTVALVKA